uniref:Uncharacterized protein n=1 Tax=Sphaerodactylus townsendi TaxID=933632 RepID=A0ACB8G1X4_9SAUR
MSSERIGSEKKSPPDQLGSIPSAMEHLGSGKAKRLATLLSGLVECMCFAGVIFGWASLVYVLKDLHYFRDLCVPIANQTANSTLDEDCRAQDEQFSLVFTIGSFMNNFMTFPTGYIFDRFGTTVARLLAILSRLPDSGNYKCLLSEDPDHFRGLLMCPRLLITFS